MTEPRPPEGTSSGMIDETATIEDLPTRPDYRPMPDSVTGAGAGGSAGDGAPGGARAGGARRGIALRWLLALAGIAIVLAGSYVIVSLAGGRPAASVALGYMPPNVISYVEVRLDLPGDQRQKLASFLHTGRFPGFADQAQITPKVEDVYDRLIRLASSDKQTYTADIQPWFSGQLAIGQGLPNSPLAMTSAAGSLGQTLVVAPITDRAKAIAWVTGTADSTALNRSTYNGADLFTTSHQGSVPFVAAITDKVLLAGTEADVKAAVDGGGNGPLAQDADMKAALATVGQDYVMLTVSRPRAMIESYAKLLGASQPGILERTQIDETLLAMTPAWQAGSARFDDDALTMTQAAPPWAIGFDAKNGSSDLLGHVPANALVYLDGHDVGPALTALLDRFRALPEAKTAFDQFDQALSLVGGPQAVYGWWGDTAFVVAPGADGTIGGGLVIHPTDATAAERLATTLRGFVALGGSSAGLALRDEDHNGTKITVLDLSKVPGMNPSAGGLPPGYKAEVAWAVNQDVVVLGYGRDFVASILDAGPGHSLADDARFKALLGRVGADNISAGFVDIGAIRRLVEPLIQTQATPDEWARYVKEIQPYLAPFDALVQAVHKDGGVDRGASLVTVH